jgi:hypothetical protein
MLKSESPIVKDFCRFLENPYKIIENWKIANSILLDSW